MAMKLKRTDVTLVMWGVGFRETIELGDPLDQLLSGDIQLVQ